MTPVVGATPPLVSTPITSVSVVTPSSIDAERARELDALATAILKQHLATPKTLVGLGIPDASAPQNSSPVNEAPVEPPLVVPAPVEPPLVNAALANPELAEPLRVAAGPLSPTLANAALIEAALADADDDDETIVMPERRAQSPAELAATQRHTFQPIQSAPREEAPSKVASVPISEPKPPSETITPPPPEDASVLDFRSLPSTVRYEVASELPKREGLLDSARSRTSQSDAPWALAPSRPRKAPKVGTRLALMVVAFGASLAATLALVNALVPSRKGNLLVTAAGPNQIRVDQAEVLLDGKPACSQVPCRLEGLSAGAHAVTVRAPGYENMAAQPIVVRGGGDSALQLTLTRRDTAVLRVNTRVSGLAVRVDGEDRGAAPATLSGLPPGEHSVRLSGNPAYAPFEQRVVLEADRTLTIEPQLTALHSVLHLERGRGAEDARVELVSGSDHRVLAQLPADIELSPGQVYRVRASKRNFQDFEAEVHFEEGVAERSLAVTLLPRDEKASANGRREPSSAAAPAIAPAAAPVGSGTLNINSIPISSVLLDGHPIGSTPQRLTLSSGPHSVVFVHPSLGRKESRINVVPGKAAVAAVRF